MIGNLVALAQSNVRRLLAYSAVAHAGYTLLGLVAGGREGFAATLFYTTIYAFTLVGAFGVVALVRRETGGDDLAHFSALWSRSPLLAGCMTIFMLSLAGLPPLAGFFGKFYLFSAALRAGGNQGLLWLVALALLGSFISLYYYLAVLKAIFVDDPEPGTAESSPSIELDLLDGLHSRSSISISSRSVLPRRPRPDRPRPWHLFRSSLVTMIARFPVARSFGKRAAPRRSQLRVWRNRLYLWPFKSLTARVAVRKVRLMNKRISLSLTAFFAAASISFAQAPSPKTDPAAATSPAKPARLANRPRTQSPLRALRPRSRHVQRPRPLASAPAAAPMRWRK